MQLLQAMSEEETYAGAQGDHAARRTDALRKPTHPPGDRSVSRVGLEFSYSAGVAAPWGEVEYHCTGRGLRGTRPAVYGRSALADHGRASLGAPLEALSSPLQQVGACRYNTGHTYTGGSAQSTGGDCTPATSGVEQRDICGGEGAARANDKRDPSPQSLSTFRLEFRASGSSSCSLTRKIEAWDFRTAAIKSQASNTSKPAVRGRCGEGWEWERRLAGGGES
jgi:hypothetical protein